MQVTVEKTQLADAVGFAGAAIAANPVTPVYRCVAVHIDVTDDGASATFTGHDPSSGMTSTATIANVTVDGQSTSWLLPGPALKSIIASLPSGDVTIETRDEDSKLAISVGKTRFAIPVVADTWPTLASKKTTFTATVDAPAFAAAVANARRACSPDPNGVVTLTGIQLSRGSEGPLTLASTDRYRLYTSGVDVATESTDPLNVVVPGKELDSIVKLLVKNTDTIGVRIGTGSIEIVGDGKTTTLGLLDGDFPSWQKLLPETNSHTVTIDPEALVDALARAAVAQDGQSSHAARLTFTNDTVTVTMDSDLEFADELSCDYSGEQMTLGVNPAYVKDGLAAMRADKVTIGFDDPARPLLLTPAHDNPAGVKYLAMPVKLSR